METVPKLYYRSDAKTIRGPLLPIEIEDQIRSNKLPANVLVCEEGHDVWTDFPSWQKAKMKIALHGFSLSGIVILVVFASIGVLLLAFLAMIFVIGLFSS
jgi:hypothetical protein